MSDKQNIQEYSKETIRIRIRDMQDNPIALTRYGAESRTKDTFRHPNRF